MTKQTFKEKHRLARLGNLGTLAVTTGNDFYQWLLTEVYDLRFPHVGEHRYLMQRTFDAYRDGAFLWAIKWKRQQAYASGIRFCPSCKSHHHYAQPCYR